MSNKIYELNCSHCQRGYEAKSAKSQYCGVKCRTAAHRLRKIKAIDCPKGEKIGLLMDESDKISKQLRVLMTTVRLGKADKYDWFVIDDLQARDRVLIREMADLVAN